jgi:hypothetical protein
MLPRRYHAAKPCLQHHMNSHPASVRKELAFNISTKKNSPPALTQTAHRELKLIFCPNTGLCANSPDSVSILASFN